MIILWLACQHFPMRPTPVAGTRLGLLLTSAHQQCTQQQPQYEIIQCGVTVQPESPLRIRFVHAAHKHMFSMSVLEGADQIRPP